MSCGSISPVALEGDSVKGAIGDEVAQTGHRRSLQLMDAIRGQHLVLQDLGTDAPEQLG